MNAIHLNYLNAGFNYDNCKKGLYTAIELSLIDEEATSQGK